MTLTVTASHQMKLYYSINGCSGYVELVKFHEYNNGGVAVSLPGQSAEMKTKSQARMIAKKLLTQGYKFV